MARRVRDGRGADAVRAAEPSSGEAMTSSSSIAATRAGASGRQPTTGPGILVLSLRRPPAVRGERLAGRRRAPRLSAVRPHLPATWTSTFLVFRLRVRRPAHGSLGPSVAQRTGLGSAHTWLAPPLRP